LPENNELEEDNDCDDRKQVLQGMHKGVAESLQVEHCLRLVGSGRKCSLITVTIVTVPVLIQLKTCAFLSFIRKMPKIDHINFNYKFETTKVTTNVIALLKK
jgi:hypothetical protein